MANASTSRINLPAIKLDKTLSELYHQHCPSLTNKRIGHIFCGTTCAASLSQDFPRNRKYVYQDSSFNDAGQASKTDDEVQQILAPKYLSLVPQRDAFIAGDSAVFFFYSGREKEIVEHDEAETRRTLAVLDESQKPETVFCSGPSQVAKEMMEKKIDCISSKLVVDAVVETAVEKMLCAPDSLWYLNSKEALANSGLPTPKATIIEVDGHCPDAASCCEACEEAERSAETVIPEACTGPRKRWIGEQSIRILSAVEKQPLPFVFKNNQTFGGAGTYVITKGPERNQLIEDMTHGGILRRMLSFVSAENEHMKPGTVLLTSMISDPVADYGITFFVSESGSATFLAASEQMIDRESASWVGSNISFSHQAALQDRFGLIIGKVGKFLHQHGYFGPAGVDILETKDGDYQIVDLNVRTSGSLALPLLRTHFTSRGFYSASSISVTVEKSRDEFCQQWRVELEAGQLCILAWYEDQRAGKSYGDVVVGAEDEDHLAQMLEKVRKDSEQVTF